jgi:hypothetical protein
MFAILFALMQKVSKNQARPDAPLAGLANANAQSLYFVITLFIELIG